MRTPTEQRPVVSGWRRALRVRYVVPALALVVALLMMRGGPDHSLCGCMPPWFFDDPDTLVP